MNSYYPKSSDGALVFKSPAAEPFHKDRHRSHSTARSPKKRTGASVRPNGWLPTSSQGFNIRLSAKSRGSALFQRVITALIVQSCPHPVMSGQFNLPSTARISHLPGGDPTNE